jgi:hypothetical protein
MGRHGRERYAGRALQGGDQQDEGVFAAQSVLHHLREGRSRGDDQ